MLYSNCLNYLKNTDNALNLYRIKNGDEPIMSNNKPKRDKTPIFHSRKSKIWNSN